MLETCPHCRSRVLYITDYCPHCQKSKAGGTPDPQFTSAMKSSGSPPRRETRQRGQSYAVGWGFVIAAVITNFVGLSVTESAVREARRLPFFQSGQALNRAATMEVTFKILILLFGLIGIISLIRTFMVRRRRAQTTTTSDDKAA